MQRRQKTKGATTVTKQSELNQYLMTTTALYSQRTAIMWRYSKARRFKVSFGGRSAGKSASVDAMRSLTAMGKA